MLPTHLHPVLGLRMIELYLYCSIELYGMHGDNLTAVPMHTITSHPQVFTYRNFCTFSRDCSSLFNIILRIISNYFTAV